MRLLAVWVWVLVLACNASGLAADPGVALDEKEFTKLHANLQPPKDEAWLSIPWKVSLLKARELAVREQKPIFIWSMDGHPLGCG